MAGVKGKSGRTGGNPDLGKFAFTTDRVEPCSERIQIRMPRSLKLRIHALPDWPEQVRTILENNVPELDDSM
jgi:hypothetical protein